MIDKKTGMSMGSRWFAGFLVVPLVLGAGGLAGPAAPANAAVPARAAVPVTAQPAAQAVLPPELAVDQQRCSASGGTGSADDPFCTISAAAAVVQPGQTVLVEPGHYEEVLTIRRSGTPEAPITFRSSAVRGDVRIGKVRSMEGPTTGSVIIFAGVHDVALRDFVVEGVSGAPAVTVDGSTRVTIDGNGIRGATASGGVRITGASRDVTVSRQWFLIGGGPVVAVGAGTVNAVVVGNQGYSRVGMVVTDAPDTVVTGNTIITTCGRGIDVAGDSPGASIRNNIVATAGSVRQVCADPAAAAAITVAAGSTARSVVDHNLVDPVSGGPFYVWGGTAHTTRDSFVASTGQGVNDLATNPGIDIVDINYWRSWITLRPGSPAIDSADGSAPGALPSDILGNPYSDDPSAANTGTGSGYRDRGAWERQGTLDAGAIDIRRAAGGGPLDTVATITPTHSWPVEREEGRYAFQFGDQTVARISDVPRASYTYRRAGVSCVSYYVSPNGFRRVNGGVGTTDRACTVTGSYYTAVAPTRLLDTRTALGIPTTVPVAAGGRVTLDLPQVAGVPVADISSIVLNVTVTSPTTAGFLKVYSSATGAITSSVNFVANETVPNLVTVPVRDGRIYLENASGGTVHLVADLQGYYSAHGSGFAPMTPTRVLDTRSAAPVAPNGDLHVDLSDVLPADVTAAILNVTVTQPTTAGVLTVYPNGTPVPMASNLNFVAGQTIPNLVTVPVVGGKVAIRNVSSGTTHVVADLAGYFGSAASGATQSYVPYGPSRIADSRTGDGLIDRTAGPLEKQAVASVEAWYYKAFDGADCGSDCPAPTAVVANLTVTAPTTAGVLTAFPHRTTPPTASNVNFVAGETASNLAVIKTRDAVISLYNNSSGSSHVLVDQAGYFIAAA
ncbi:right-handed parallel beta-helix repeat-containing protein [Micromonospora sp. NPDC050695]|uniref:right-handed parallel beta-helix repeat-containing protein n=1 Tax=Micromonospora sp. NPDC050695 TaxID=3154938 RepID=UPI0033EA28D9